MKFLLVLCEKLHANPYAGDGTIHPDMHLLFIDELCGLFKLAGLSRDEVKKKILPFIFGGKSIGMV